MKMLLKVSRFGFAHHSKIGIIGGGTAGINLAAHLLRSNINAKDITIFQPSPYHYYQPGWTLVGRGLVPVETTRQLTDKVVPKGVHLVKQSVEKIKPEKNMIITNRNHQYTYDQLIIAAGMKLDWDKVKGSKELLQDPLSNVCSVYDYKYADKTSNLGRKFKGGKAIFSEPIPPIKCSGAPMKILFLWTHGWKYNPMIKFQSQLVKAQAVLFSIPKYSKAIQKIIEMYKIPVTLKHNLVEVTAKTATFQNLQTNQKIVKQFDFLHLVPPMSPPSFIKQSGLGTQFGFVEVDKYTLRNDKFLNVWSLGDCSSLPTSKTATAVFTQTQVLMEQLSKKYRNLLAVLKNPNIKDLPAKYDGYTGCPLMVGGKKAMLAQFLYEGKIDETFFSDQSKPRRIFYYLTKYLFPFAYWKLMPRGLWLGRDGIRWF